ncbi:PrpF domain-containing protein [Pseudogemmobacter sp. W21_MBD1_M6]|uniref:PrpF domain-containing protein n=1 Tax=Pseudogemmobacter sp. W21_MBD1_M6 TaxID=3240271 RepID=UPI003F9A1704
MPKFSAFNMRCLDAMIIRGGSSKGVYLDVRDLPPAGPQRDSVILKIFGSPDKRQIDGLGGADKLTSKVCLMGPPTRSDCDIDYLFGQVNQTLPKIDWTSNCGNLSSGAAYYAALKGYGQTTAGDTMHVRVHQVNLGRRILAQVPMRDSQPEVEGDFAIGGVPGTAARIDLDFGDFAGAVLKRGLLPTGNPKDLIDVPGVGQIETSIVDMANLHVFVRAIDMGLDTSLSIYDLQADASLVQRLENVRAAACRHIGFGTGHDMDELMRISVNPLIFVVAPPVGYTSITGDEVAAEDHDLFARSMARYEFSKAYPGSGSVGTAVAAGIPGTVAHAATRSGAVADAAFTLRIGHPGGTLSVDAAVNGNSRSVSYARLGRTARLLMDGRAYYR